MLATLNLALQPIARHWQFQPSFEKTGTQTSRVKYTMSKIQNQIFNQKRQYASIVWFMGFYLTVILGCAAVTGGARKDPRILIIRNSSGAGIRSVTLGTADSSDRHHGKYGTISPVPSGVSQVYFRPDSAPPLPKKLLISWVTNDSISHARELSPAAATKSAHDSRANAMVFEIHPGDLVNIYWEVFSDERSEGRGN